MEKLTVRSPVFAQNTIIPKKYTCDGDGINPPLTIEDVPKQAKSLSLIMDDPDAPSGTFDHWVVWNIPLHPPQKSLKTLHLGQRGSTARVDGAILVLIRRRALIDISLSFLR